MKGLFSMPDQFPVQVDFSDAAKRSLVNMSLRIDDLKRKPVSRDKPDLLQRNLDDQVIVALIAPGHEIPLFKRPVPANLAE